VALLHSSQLFPLIHSQYLTNISWYCPTALVSYIHIRFHRVFILECLDIEHIISPDHILVPLLKPCDILQYSVDPRGPAMYRTNLPPNTLFLSPIVILFVSYFQRSSKFLRLYHISSTFSSSYFDIGITYASKIFIASTLNPSAIIHSILSSMSLSAFEPLLLRFFQPFHLPE